MKKALYIALPLLFAVLLGWVANEARLDPDEPVVVAGYEPWNESTIEEARTIPVQSGGRIMPLDTYARFALYRLSGRRSVPFAAEEGGKTIRLEPIEWLLDSMLRPELAVDMPVILVDNAEVFESLDLSEDLGEERDRYSLAQLAPSFAALDRAAAELRLVDQAHYDASQRQMADLYAKVAEYNQLVDSFAWARQSPMERTSIWQTGLEVPAPSVLELARNPVLIDSLFGLDLSEKPDFSADQLELARSIAAELEQSFAAFAGSAGALALVPPADPDRSEWWTPGELLVELRRGSEIDRDHALARLDQLEQLGSRESREQAATELLAWKNAVQADVTNRDEGGKVAGESRYYQAHLLGWAQLGYWLLFGLALLTLARREREGWLPPISRWIGLLPVLLLAAAIAWRCWLRERPPVTNLYDTFLFVTAVATLVGWIVERMTHRRIPLLLTSLLGILGLVAAARFEVGMGVDTAAREVAVLDTNYWLTIHVLTIATGYSAAVLAAAVAMAWLVVRAIEGPKHELLKFLGTTAYALTCFGVLFATVGTILGGVWANESWGRFWGWDPKENGALMIVLCQLAVLHGRLGGILRPLLFNTAVVATGFVTLFSWFHVNLLGVGLHSYGFSQAESLWRGLYTGYGILGTFILLGLALAVFDPRGRPSQAGRRVRNPDAIETAEAEA